MGTREDLQPANQLGVFSRQALGSMLTGMTDNTAGPFVTAQGIEELASITHRQLDHWVGKGILEAVGEANPGQGQNRHFGVKQVLIARALVRARDALTVRNGGALSESLTKAIQSLSVDGLLADVELRAGPYVVVRLDLGVTAGESRLREWLAQNNM